MKHTRIISIILLAAISCFYVCSCDKGTSKGETISSDSLWYDSERIAMDLFPDNKNVNVFDENIDYNSEQIRVFCRYDIPPTEEEMLSEDFDYSLCDGADVCVFDDSGKQIKKISVQKLLRDSVDPYVRIVSTAFLGNKLYILSESDTGTSKDVVSIIDIERGSVIENIEYTSECMREIRSVYSDKIILVKEDVFMMVGDYGSVLLFDKEGNFRTDPFSNLFGEDCLMWDAYSDQNGTVRFSCSNGQDSRKEVELGADTVTYETFNYDISNSYGSGMADDGVYYSINNSGISKYNSETKVFDMIIPSECFNSKLNELTKMSVLSASGDDLLLVNTHDMNPKEGVIAYKLSKAEMNPNAGKIKLTVGLFGDYVFSQTVGEAIYTFNTTSDKYFASARLYDYKLNHFEDADTMEKARQEEATVLMRDILDGSGPDVIVNAFDIQELNDSKYLCDLNDFIKSDDQFNRDEYINSIIELANTDGKLYQMPLKYGTLGLSASSKYAPSNYVGYSFDEYIDVVSEANNGADKLAYVMDRSSYYSLLFTSMSGSFYSDGEWNLNCPEYEALAEYCKEYVPKRCLADWDDDNFIWPDFRIENPQVDCISHYIGSVYSRNLDLYGYPSMDGDHGVMIDVKSSAAICSQSKNKEGAWEFVKLLTSPEIQSVESNFSSINLEVLTELGKEAVVNFNKKVAEYKSMDEKKLAELVQTGEPVLIEEIDDSAIDAYIDLLNKSTGIYRVDGQVLIISKEEIQAYYSGQKSLADVVSIMDNRIKLYRNEQG